MNIKGWAYDSASQSEYYNRCKELKEKGVDIYVSSMQSGYAHAIYEGVVIDDMGEELAALDIGLLCDNGNLCFGGNGTLDSNGKFRFKVHTD